MYFNKKLRIFAANKLPEAWEMVFQAKKDIPKLGK